MILHLSRRALHWLFEATLALKGVFAILETLGGLGLWMTSHDNVARFVDWLTRGDLLADPDDWLAHVGQAALAHFSVDTQHFVALYMLAHGAIKLAMVAGLAVGWRPAYPLAMVGLTGFILYQMHRWTQTGAPLLLAISALDALLIWLVWREWQGLRDRPASGG